MPPEYKVDILVTVKDGVPDANLVDRQKKLNSGGFEDATVVQTGKLFEIVVTADDEQSARDFAENASTTLLANPVMEQYSIISVKEK